jgi:ATP-dependent Lon protease
MATAMLSAFTDRPVARDIAMTGEITLRGNVLPVGGIKEKVLAARRSGIRTVIVPAVNRKNLEDIPSALRKDLKFVFVKDVQEVFAAALREPSRAPEPAGPAAKNKRGPRKT